MRAEVRIAARRLSQSEAGSRVCASIVTSSQWRLHARWIQRMPRRTLALKPERTPVLAQARRFGGIDAFGEIELLLVVAITQSGKNALRRERRFAETNASRVEDRVGNRGNRCSKRT